jgi:cytochrome oxidase Cu insertion factor (SCO1/SenC/PrrC family)
MLLRRIRWVLYGAIAACLAAAGALWLWGGGVNVAELRNVGISAAVSVGGPFALTDDQGKAVTDQTYRGRWMLVYFGYTFCPDVCPTELQTIAGALDKLGPEAKSVVPLFITIDPERDTPAALANYVKLFDDRLIGLTGTPEQISTVARAYRVYYAKVTPKDSTTYLMDHSSFVYLVGPDGKLRALFRPGESAQELADGIRARMATS